MPHPLRWEAKAERPGRQLDQQWSRDWRINLENLPDRIVISDEPDGVFLGIESTDISIEKAKALGFENPYGSYVSRVISNSAAASAGLLPFDYIYGANDQRTSNNQDLADILEDFEPGDEVTLYFIRKGEKHTVNVRLGSYEEYDREAEGRDQEEHGFLGVSPGEDESDDDLDGVSVEVAEESAAAEMGLIEGDVIVGINGYPVLDWDDVETAISNMQPGDPIEVIFERDAGELSAKGTVKSYRDAHPDDEHSDLDIDVDWDEIGNIRIELPDELAIGWDQEDRAFLGIYTDMISEEKARKLGFENPYGSYVTGILKNTAAEKAGIKPFDYLYGIDEYRVGENQSLGGIMKKYRPGDKATLHFLRKGRKSSASIQFGRHDEAEKVSRNSCEDPFFGIIQLSKSGDSNVDGVSVKPVKGSTAEELGLMEGDVITAINGYKIIDWQDITTAIEMLNPGETIAVDYRRDNKSMKASKAIRSYAETKKCENCDCGQKEEVVISLKKPDFKVNFNWNDKDDNHKPSAPRIDPDAAKVTMENITSSESSSLKSKGLDFSNNSTLSVENLRLAPNPNAGMFSLDFRLSSSGETVVRLYNAAGRVIYEYELGNFSGDFHDSVDISQNGPGDYFLQITQNGKVFSKKIVLTKS